ncbi:MAG TPA: zinc ribbon domain-containing protein [Terriglobia bacterium]|nr:zinc ribbon domain-containing protein [Terriglobia bacterium]
MPIFEYLCPRCGYSFEKLVLRRSDGRPECPQCGAKRVEQVFSAFATKGATPKSAGQVCAPSGGG